MEDKLEILYNGLKDKYDLGDLESFRIKMSDPSKQKAFYDAVSPKVELGSFQDFSAKISQKKSPSGSVSPDGSSIQESAPVAAANSDYSLTVTDAGQGGGSMPVTTGAASPEFQKTVERDKRATDNRIALSEVRKSRKGDYQSDAVERMERGLSDYERAELAQRTPLEKTFNTDVTSKEYKAQSIALSKDQSNLNKGIDAIDEEIITEFGEAAFERYGQDVADYERLYAEYSDAQKNNKNFSQDKADYLNQLRDSINKFQEHPLVQERNGMIGAMQKNLARFEEMQKADNYKGVRDMLDTQKEIQSQTDSQKGGMMSNIAINSLAKMAAGIGRLADSVEQGLGIDKEYGKLDVIENFLIDLGTDAEMLFPAPGQFSRQLNTSTAEWNGYEVDVNGDNLTFIKDGKPVEVNVTEEQEKEIKALPRKNKWNFIGAPYQMGQVVGDMAVMIAGAGKISKGLTAVGIGEAAAARTGVALSTAGQMSTHLYEQGLEMFDGDKQKASQYAVIGGLSIGVSSNLFGLESRLVNGTKGLASSIPKMNVPAAVGQMSVKQRAAQSALHILKQAAGEGFEESILENGVLALNSAMLGGNPQEMNKNEIISEGVMGFAAGALFAGGTVNQELNGIQKSSLLAASQDPRLFGDKLRKEIAAGRIDGDEEFVAKQVSRVTRIGAELEKLSPDIKGDRLLDAVALLDRQGEVQGRLDEVKGNEALELKYQQELDAINEELNSTFKDVPVVPSEKELPTVVEKTVEKPTVAENAQVEPTMAEKISEKVDRSPIKEKLDRIVNKTIEDEIAIDLSNGRRIRTSDYDNSSDPNNRRGSNIALRYTSQKGDNIDVWAQELSEKWGIDEKEAEQRIIDVINDNPKGLKDYAERRLAEDMAIEEGFQIEADEVVDSIPEEQARILETFLEKFEVDGDLDENALEAAFNEAEAGFSPEFLELQEAAPQAYQELKNIINERAKKISEAEKTDTPFGEEIQETGGQPKKEAVSSVETTVKADKSSGFSEKTEPKGVISDLSFTTHKGDTVKGERLATALNEVADDMVEIQNRIREEDEYASHVTEAEKDENLDRGLKYAEEVRQGQHLGNMTIAQRVNQKLTGESVPILPSPKSDKKKSDAQKISEKAKKETRYDKNPEQKKIIDSTGREMPQAQEEIDVEEAQKEVEDWMRGIKMSGFITDADVKKFAKIAYKYIKAGVKTLADFAKMVGKKVSELSEAGWNRAKARHGALTNDVNIRDGINLKDSMIQFVADRDRYVKVAIDRLKKAGAAITSDMDAYLQKQLANSKTDALVRALYEDIFGVEASKIGAGKKNAVSMKSRMERDGITWDRFNDLMYALHAKERNSRVEELVRKRNEAKIDALEQKILEESVKQVPNIGKMNGWQSEIASIQSEPPFENGSGMSDMEADAMIAQAKTDGVFDAFTKYEKEFREKVLKGRVDILLEGGLITQEQATALLTGKREGFDSEFEHYVPLYVKEEFLEEDIPSEGANIISAKIYGLRGSKTTKEQRHRPADMAVVLMAQSIKSAEQNKVLNSMAKLVESNPLDKQWKVVPSKSSVKLSPIGEVITIDDYTPDNIKKNAVQFKQDGKTKYIFVMPTKDGDRVVQNPIITAFKASPRIINPFWDGVLNVGRFYNTVMRTIITSVDPAFGLANAARDIQEAMTNITASKEEKGLKAVRRKILKNYTPALKAIMQSPWTEGGSRMADYWVEMKKAGVPMTWRSADDIGSDIENIQEYINKTDPNAKSFFKGIYERMAFINDSLENVTRLSVYAAMRDSGVDAEYAAGVAKNVTVNFEKKGQAGTVINAFYLFASPGIQGAYNTMKLASSKKGMAVLGGITAAAAMMRALLYLQMDDDDIEEYIYNDFKSSQYMYVPNPLDPKNPITIPKSYSLVRVSQGLGEGMVDMMMGKKTAFGVMSDLTLNTFSVLDPFGGANRSFSAFIPSMFHVPSEISMNRNWAGSKVYHFDFDPSKPDKFELNTGTFGEKLPVPMTDIEYTDMARYLYDIGADVSPTTLEYISKAYLTGVIKTAYNLEQTVDALANNEPVDSRKVPVLSRFYQDIGDTQRNMLYNVYSLTEKENLTNDQKKYLKEKLPDLKKLMSPQAYGKLASTVNKKFFMDKDKWMKEEQEKFNKRAKKAEKINIFK